MDVFRRLVTRQGPGRASGYDPVSPCDTAVVVRILPAVSPAALSKKPAGRSHSRQAFAVSRTHRPGSEKPAGRNESQPTGGSQQGGTATSGILWQSQERPQPACPDVAHRQERRGWSQGDPCPRTAAASMQRGCSHPVRRLAVTGGNFRNHHRPLTQMPHSC